MSLERWISDPEMIGSAYLWPSRLHASPQLLTRQDARIVRDWVPSIGLESGAYGTHSMRRTKVAQIKRKAGNRTAVQPLLGHTKTDSTSDTLASTSMMCWRCQRVLIYEPPPPGTAGAERPSAFVRPCDARYLKRP